MIAKAGLFNLLACLPLCPGALQANDAEWLGVPTPEERQATRQKAAAGFVDLGVGSLPLVGPAATDYPDIQGTRIHRYIEEPCR